MKYLHHSLRCYDASKSMYMSMSIHRSLRHRNNNNVILSCCSSNLSFGDHPSFHNNRFFSSTSSAGADTNSSIMRQNRLGRALYRQLIRWCLDTGDDIPLTSYVPPVTTMSPIVDSDALKRLADGNSPGIRELLPLNAIIEHHQMTIPIRNCYDMKNFFRAMYRMNSTTRRTQDQRDQVSFALKTLKSLNELTEALQEVRSEREKHLNREKVKLSIGQVVQHKTERWRGVILGWDRLPERPKGQLTSLTTKDYTPVGLSKGEDNEKDDTIDNIRYTMILDSGDAHLLVGRRKVRDDSGHPVAIQSELELIQDVKLCRIRSNWIAKYFQRFDATSKCFVPNEARQFEHPLDVAHLEVDDMEHQVTATRNEIGASIVQAIQRLSSRLEGKLFFSDNNTNKTRCPIIDNFKHRLSRLAVGDVLTEEDRLTNSTINDALLATLHLRWFLNMSLELAELLWQRRIAKESIHKIQYRLGDIVLHKKYGFRGVVVAWDSKPAVDVSMWDGLSEIENPNEKPFYHVIPDQNDCVRAFGGERPFRYVCEENLERCPRQRTILEVDLDPEWKNDPKTASYVPTQDLKFKHGEDIDDDGMTEQCLEALHKDISHFYVAQRGLLDQNPDEDLADIAKSLSAEVLFRFLKVSNNLDTAIAVEESIKELWKAHPDTTLRSKLDDGIADLLRGNKEKALVAFKELTVQDPQYAEAWNKASTCYFMLGDMQSSLEAAEEALALLPQHFQAMNGLGLIQYETRRYKLAATSFRQSLQMDPWSPVSSRLAACMDLLIGGDLADEIGAAEGTGPYE